MSNKEEKEEKTTSGGADDSQQDKNKGSDGQSDAKQEDQESGGHDQSSQDNKQQDNDIGQSKGEQTGDGDKKLSDAEASLTEQDPPPTILEWSVRIGSLLILVGLTIYLIATGLLPTQPPKFDVAFDVEQSMQREGRWVLPVEVINVGTLAVEDLQLTLALVKPDGEVVEEISSTISLIGQNELFNLEFWLDEDPRNFDLEIKVNSYKVP